DRRAADDPSRHHGSAGQGWRRSDGHQIERARRHRRRRTDEEALTNSLPPGRGPCTAALPVLPGISDQMITFGEYIQYEQHQSKVWRLTETIAARQDAK